MRLSDLYEHPHDRGIMTASEFVHLMSDWTKAGQPEDFVAFMAGHPTWRDMPVYLLLNTLVEMLTLEDTLDSTSLTT